MSLSVGVDIGGTFTDVIAVADDAPGTWIAKVPTTPRDYSQGVIDGLLEVLARAGRDPAAVARVVHGTTIATNAVLEHRGARIGILATNGFEDILYIGRHKRSQMYDLAMGPETPGFLCPRTRIRGVAGRIGPTGEELEPLDDEAVLRTVEHLVERERIESLAVSLLFSFVDARHERRVAELVADRWPTLDVCLSSELDPRFREYERLVLTAFEAYVRPIVARYLRQLRDRLRELGVPAPLQVMGSHGGALDASVLERRAVSTLISGPAAGALAGARVGEAIGVPNLITFDVGGTSADVALVVDCMPALSDEGKLSFYPLRQPMIDVHSIGAGGGSIARLEAGGLRVGPQSAGADPGPACFGRGGDEPTVTDASVILGYIRPDAVAGGRVSLRPELAERAVARVGAALELSSDETARGIHRIVDAAMADAVHVVSVRRGHDPRRFALLAGGGAGPLHACSVAEKLYIARVIVPPYPGLLAAHGALVAPTKAQQWQTLKRTLDELAPEELVAAIETLTQKATAAVGASEAMEGEINVRRFCDLRFKGQSHELTLPLDDGPIDAAAIASLADAFRRRHQEVYDQHDASGPVELVAVRVTAEAAAPPATVLREPRDDVDSERRDVLLPERRLREHVPVIARDALTGAVRGPAIVEQEDATTVVLPGWEAEHDAYGNLVMTRVEATRSSGQSRRGNERRTVTSTPTPH